MIIFNWFQLDLDQKIKLAYGLWNNQIVIWHSAGKLVLQSTVDIAWIFLTFGFVEVQIYDLPTRNTSEGQLICDVWLD